VWETVSYSRDFIRSWMVSNHNDISCSHTEYQKKSQRLSLVSWKPCNIILTAWRRKYMTSSTYIHSMCCRVHTIQYSLDIIREERINNKNNNNNNLTCIMHIYTCYANSKAQVIVQCTATKRMTSILRHVAEAFVVTFVSKILVTVFEKKGSLCALSCN